MLILIFRCVFLFLILFGETIAPHNPLTTQPETTAAPPSPMFLLGTDTLGRDVLSRVLYGGKITFILAFGAAAIGVGFGTGLGMLATFGGRRLHQLASLTELTLLSLPSWLMALIFITGIGACWEAVIIGVGVSQIAPFSRITRMTLEHLRMRLFVTAAESTGASQFYIALRVVLPNASPILVGAACVTLSNGLLFASGLTFLGLGGSLSTPEWGAMLAEGRLAIRYAPWIALSAGIPLVILIANLNAIGRKFTLHEWWS